ncbi:FUSC family protein [Vitiosangium sp. GDMCC 1.1324]|uniref:FUSC family protein n=1 Tax=Vitiosangium sp. (strain GDMCC 1.1324) TaxID=2138576 RepID=UPI000D3CD782|nr:FUSC family protein [Vitiosangium sp. GDMCC 1.1324]PTL77281.1 fusaric acid resistance protein [Vitiosangium sp. GDMCC 1.1324]
MLTRRLIEHSKEVARFAPVRPAVKAGLRAAIATILPLVVASVFHLTGAIWLSVGGFNTSFADKGGSYRSRASSMGAVALATALSVLVGGLAGRYPALAIPMALLWVTACSYAGVYGPAAGFVGNIAASAFVISLALPASSLREALERTGFLLVGALWAMVLSLVLWPIRPYRPARFALGRCFRAVADFAGEVGRLSTGAESAAWQALIQGHHGRIRETLEEARGTLVATRRGRQESGRGERLLVLLQIADASFGAVIALSDVMESLSHETGVRPAQEEVERTLAAFSRSLQELARVVETEGKPHQLPALDWGAEALREALSRAESAEGLEAMRVVDRAQTLHAARLLAQLREFMGIVVETAASLSDDRPSTLGRALLGIDLAERKRPFLEPLRENLSRNSVVLRHALRVGVTTAVAVWLTTALGQSHGYWVTITVLTVMLPYTGPTFLKGLQRVVGTVLGGILAALVAAELHDPHAIMALVFFTVAISVAVISVNYGLYTIFLTVTFVLLAEVGTGDWGLAEVRIINTLIGGALALAGTWLLWERPEKELFPEQLAAALRADREFFRQVFAVWLGEPKTYNPGVGESRRKMGLASINAEASFQRLLSEPRRRTEPIEPLMTLLAYTRRFAAAVIAFSTTQHEQTTEQVRALLERFAAAVEQVLEDLANAVTEGRSPEPLPDFTSLLGGESFSTEVSAALAQDAPLLRAQLERVVRQLAVLHGAASRRGTPLAPERPSRPEWSAGSEQQGG